MTSLQTLDLSFNDLSDLSSEDIFEPPANLTNVYLSSNHLTQLPMNKIMPMPNLKILDLENNEFSSFDDKLMKVIENGTTLRYTGKKPVHHLSYLIIITMMINTIKLTVKIVLTQSIQC